MTLARLLAMMGFSNPQPAGALATRWIWIAWWFGTGGILLLALAAFCQRMLGLWTQPLAGVGFFAALLCATLATATLRLVFLADESRSSTDGLNLGRQWLYWLPGIGLLLLAAGLSLPGLATASLLTGWGLVLASEGAWCGYRLGRQQSMAPVVENSADTQTADLAEEESELPVGLFQQITRTLDDVTGGETLHGHLRASFVAGDPLCILHVAFCPPTAGLAELSAEIAGDLEAEIKITQVQTFGARLEIRLPTPPKEVASVLVEIFGTVPGPLGKQLPYFN